MAFLVCIYFLFRFNFQVFWSIRSIVQIDNTILPKLSVLIYSCSPFSLHCHCSEPQGFPFNLIPSSSCAFNHDAPNFTLCGMRRHIVCISDFAVVLF